MLANIYLHYVLDRWFERKIRGKARGYCILVRYADDFVVCFQYEEEAKGFTKELKERLNKYGLEISEEKSKVIEFGRYARQKAQKEGRRLETFDFLGFTHYCDRSITGKFKLTQKTSMKKYRQKLKAANEWLKRYRNVMPLKEGYWQTLALKLKGHYQYYGISGNSKMIQQFYNETLKLAYKWINRRSQRKSYNWEQFKKFVQFNPLPKPRIYHSTYTLYSKLRMQC